MQINNGASSAFLQYGPGGDSSRPGINKWMQIHNVSGNAVFVPDKTASERRSVWDHIGKISGVNVYRGMYVHGDRMYFIRSAMGTGPCWSGSVGGTYNTPPALPGGWTEEGTYNANGVNPNDYKGDATVRPGNDGGSLAWQFYQDKGWGCGGSSRAKITIRRGYRTSG